MSTRKGWLISSRMFFLEAAESRGVLNRGCIDCGVLSRVRESSTKTQARRFSTEVVKPCNQDKGDHNRGGGGHRIYKRGPGVAFVSLGSLNHWFQS